ncbi:MAG: hypothetical protein RI601_08615 [Desulfurivibrionaceae bacterium]|nr:hypothetical protein [Desulfurivibrionaceae bacterium]
MLMERKAVTENELLAFLNKELEKTGDHEDCHFDYIIRLKVDDRTGCNWAYANMKCAGASEKSCPPSAEKIVAAARARFNVKL